MADEAQQKIESYLTKLRGHLRGLSEETTREILKELRSHIMEKAAADGMTAAAVDAALTALGRPEELAKEYVTDELLARAEVSRSPFRILGGLLRWASLSVAGFFVLVGSITGYFLGVVFILVAALKPFHPETAGLWVSRDTSGDLSLSIHMGFGYAPVAGREVLGWWVVPIGLLSGCLLLILTTRFAVLCSRLYRKSRALPSRG
jgi:HAAS